MLEVGRPPDLDGGLRARVRVPHAHAGEGAAQGGHGLAPGREGGGSERKGRKKLFESLCLIRQ